MAEVTSISDAYSWNITRIAEAFDFSRDTVRKRLREAGIRPTGKRGGNPVYALADAARALFENESRAELPEFQNPEKMAPKDRKEWYQSENERVKFMTDAKQLIPEPEHRQDLYDAFSAVVSFFENIPDKMERTGLFSPEQLELLEAESDNFRNQLYVRVKEVEPDAS
jgi:hypothetical protein